MYSWNDVSWISQYLILSVNRSAHRFVCLLMQTAAGGIARVAEVWRQKCLNRFWLTYQIDAAENTGHCWLCLLFSPTHIKQPFYNVKIISMRSFSICWVFFFLLSQLVQSNCYVLCTTSNAERSVFPLAPSSGRCLSLSHLETSWIPACTIGFWYRFS